MKSDQFGFGHALNSTGDPICGSWKKGATVMAMKLTRRCNSAACNAEHQVFIEGQLTRFVNYVYICPNCQKENRFREGAAVRFDQIFPKNAIVAEQMG
jgi:hypothetical protein